MSSLRWWQRPFTFTLGDGTVKEVKLEPIRNLTRDLRTDKGILDYEDILMKMDEARVWLADRTKKS